MYVILSILACGGGQGFDIAVDSGSVTEFCGDSSEELSSGFEDALTADGCRWYVTAVNSEGTVALVLDTLAFAEASVGESADVTYTLPDADVTLDVDIGCGFEAACDAVGSATSTWSATAGTVAVSAVPDGDGSAVAVSLVGVVFEDGVLGAVTVEDWSFNVTLYAAP